MIGELYEDDDEFIHHHWYITATDGKLQGFEPTFRQDFQNFKVDGFRLARHGVVPREA
jgi:hypothetical protein